MNHLIDDATTMNIFGKERLSVAGADAKTCLVVSFTECAHQNCSI